MKKITFRIITALNILLIMVVMLIFSATKELGSYAKEEDSQVEVRTATSDMSTAIVNLDEGVTTNGNYTNYGNVLIGLLGKDIKVTSLEDARTGNDEGSYSSYIIIPNTFSSQVATLNTQPEKATITYAISPAAEGDERLEILKEIYNIYEVFGNNLSQVYTSSVLKEIHQIQDDSSALMARDIQDMEALEAISGYDLIEIIEIPELTQVENTILALDLNNYLTIAQNKITDVDSSYKDFLTNGETDLDVLKGQAATTSGEVAQVEEKLSTVSSGLDSLPDTFADTSSQEEIDMNTRVDDLKDVIDNYNTNLASYNSSLAAEEAKADAIIGSYQTLYSNLAANYSIGSNTAGDGSSFKGYDEAQVNAYKAAVNAYMTVVDAYETNVTAYQSTYEDYLIGLIVANLPYINSVDTSVAGAQENAIKSLISYDPGVPEVTDPAPSTAADPSLSEPSVIEIDVAAYAADQEPLWPAEQAQVDTADTDAKIQAIVDYSKTTNQSKQDTLDTLGSDISTIKANNLTLNQTFTSQKESYSSLQTNLSGYSLLSYIDSAVISNHVGELSDNQSDMETVINDQNSQYETYVSDVYTTTSENITKLQENISDGQERSDNRIEETLAEAKSQRSSSSQKNIDILSDFTNRLSYSRIGTLENKTVYDFMADPIILSDQSLAANTKTKEVLAINNTLDTTESNQGKYIRIGALIAAVILLLIIGQIARIRKKARLNQDF